MKTSFLPLTWVALLGATAISYGQSSLVATYLPHGPADPPNPAWGPTAYRDIPWWFEDSNPYWADNNLPNGAADAYDVSVVYAARLNRNNSTGYEASLINMPGAVGSHYGAPGGAFGSSANSVVWGNAVTWSFSFIYDWANGDPQAYMTFQNGSTVHSASAALGSRILDFVNGTGPYLETHILSDMMMRFATIGTYGTTPGFTHSSLTVSDLSLRVNNGPAQDIVYYTDNVEQSSLTTAWNHVPGGTSETNPRQVEFLLLNDVIPGHESRVEMTGNLSFAWTGNANSISTSGLMFEMKFGDLDFFPDAEIQIPEPSVPLLGACGVLLLLTRRRRAPFTA